MELKDYVKIIGLRFWLLLLVVVVVTAGAVFFTISQPKTYDGSVSINITKTPEENAAGDYTYDEYYGFQASSLFSDTVLNWLQDPNNVIEIYDSANLELPTEKLSKLAKVISATKKQPATIDITMSNTEESAVNDLINSAVNFVEDKITTEKQTGNLVGFNIDYSNTTVLEHQKSVVQNAVIGFVVGLVLGLGIIFLVEYFNPKYKK